MSSTSVRIDARNFAVASDANNGSLTWSILDPLLDVYSSFTAALNGNIAWWCAQGPSVLKIPITAAAVGIFEVGMYEYDSGLALIHLQDAQRLYQMGDSVSGVTTELRSPITADISNKVAATMSEIMPEVVHSAANESRVRCPNDSRNICRIWVRVKRVGTVREGGVVIGVGSECGGRWLASAACAS